ncbi:MAG TPA: PqiC family protein [Candidatus Binataceae bacterium]
MAGRLAHLVSIVMLAAAVAGCGTTAPSRYYNLDSTAVADGAPPERVAIMVGPVSIPASVDQPQFVVQVAPNRVDVDEFNRWVAPLNDSIARAVAGDLAVLLGTSDVAAGPLANFEPAYRVTIAVLRFDSIRGEAAVLEAVWTVHKTAGGETRSGRTIAREPVQGQSFEALAAAHSRALATMSGDIATAIRAEAAVKPSQAAAR